MTDTSPESGVRHIGGAVVWGEDDAPRSIPDLKMGQHLSVFQINDGHIATTQVDDMHPLPIGREGQIEGEIDRPVYYGEFQPFGEQVLLCCQINHGDDRKERGIKQGVGIADIGTDMGQIGAVIYGVQDDTLGDIALGAGCR